MSSERNGCVPLGFEEASLDDDTVEQQDRHFQATIRLKGVERMLPAADYRVVTDEELIEGLSFPAYRRIATMIFIPAQHSSSSIEMLTIEPLDLQAAQE